MIRFGRAEKRAGKRLIRVRIKKIFVRIRPTRTLEMLAVAVPMTTPREAIMATLSPLKSVQGKAFLPVSAEWILRIGVVWNPLGGKRRCTQILPVSAEWILPIGFTILQCFQHLLVSAE